MNIVTRSVDVGGKTISFETGKLAKQASGAIVVRCGDSMLLVSAVCAPSDRPADFFPLTVDYQDRNGANGTIPGGFLKR
ncbi:MAG: polyribonucleotide nucleotidyltransferase, partial [Myxococcales bacterium]|nr:polyribonucleotide nucleotidyltransferase [Myxococcales bacterium]